MLSDVEAGDDLGHVAQERRVVEAGIERRERQAAGDGRIDGEQVVQRRALVGGPQRGALDDRVGLLARHAGLLDEGQEDAAAGMEAEAALDVLAHPLGPDDEPIDEPGHLHEHVVEHDRRVRQDDPLGAAVADVALVPERLVLERGVGVAAQEPGETGDPLGQDRVALVGHRRAALLARLERLLQLPDLRVLEVADLGRETLERPADDGDRGEQRRVPVALDDLGADRVRVQAQRGEDLGLDGRIEVAVRPDRARDLAGPDLVHGGLEPATAAIELERPAGELEPERGGLGVDRVGPAHHHGLGLEPGPGDEGGEQAIGVVEEPFAGRLELEGEARCRRHRCWSGRGAGSDPRVRRSRRPG